MRIMATAVLHQEVRRLPHGIPSSAASEMQVTKRQRRPSVRLGEIGDEPMPLVLEKTFKRKKVLQPSPEHATAVRNDYIHQGFGHETDPDLAGVAGSKGKNVGPLKQTASARGVLYGMNYPNGDDDALDVGLQKNPQIEDYSTDDCLRPLLKVNVDLKRRTKRGKHVNRKCTSGNHFGADSTSEKDVLRLDENFGPIPNPLVVDAPCSAACTDEYKDAQTEQKVSHEFDSLWKGQEHGDGLIKREANGKLRSDGRELKLKEVPVPNQGAIKERCMNEETSLKEQVRDPEVNTYPNWRGVAAGHNPSVPKSNEELPAASVDAQVPSLSCEVARWLESLSLRKYAHLFEVHEVDKDVLPLLTIEDLREMGIAAVGARRKLFTAIQVMNHKEL